VQRDGLWAGRRLVLHFRGLGDPREEQRGDDRQNARSDGEANRSDGANE
jgi:hypothetical protein